MTRCNFSQDRKFSIISKLACANQRLFNPAAPELCVGSECGMVDGVFNVSIAVTSCRYPLYSLVMYRRVVMLVNDKLRVREGLISVRRSNTFTSINGFFSNK